MKKKADVKRILLIGIPLLVLAIGVKLLDDEARILWFERNEPTSTATRFYLFSGEKERLLKAREDQTVEISWNPELERGKLILEVRSSEDGEIITTGGVPRTMEVTLRKGETLRLTVRGDGAKGRFLLEWETGS